MIDKKVIDRKAKIAIIGGGVAGSSAALYLGQLGTRCHTL